MSLSKWEDSVKMAKIKLGMNPKKVTRGEGKLLKEAQAIDIIVILNTTKS